MKTGFICDAGYNIVVSATRDGRKLVAIVLGEQSLRSRRDRATDLLDNGFLRYFWKSLFGSSLDGLAVQASLSDEPAHLHDSICGTAKAKSALDKSTRRRGLRSRLHRLDAHGRQPTRAVSRKASAYSGGVER
jgi:D-alanyl-D-alanine carboxypeptidase